MSIHVALNHVTHYRYDRLVALGPQSVRLRPAPHCRTRILSYSLRVEPAEHFVNWQQDPEANYLARLTFPEKTQELRITVDLVAEMAVLNPFDFFLEPYARQFPFAYEATELSELAPYLVKLPPTPLLTKYLEATPRENASLIDFLVDINTRLSQDIRYLIRMQPGVQTPEDTLLTASGSCRDSAWLLVQLLRHLGLAARFVSGYLIQLTADVKSLDGPTGPATDFTDLHAWCEVYLPGAGWIGFDPTSGLLAGEGHIPLALYAGALFRRSCFGTRRGERGRIRAHHVCAARVGSTARHQALYPGAMGRRRSVRSRGRRRAEGARRAPHHGWRAHLRRQRRPRR